MKTTLKNGELKRFSQDEVLRALISLDNVFDGATINYFALKDTATRVKDSLPLDDLPYLEFGVWQRNLNKYALSCLRDRLGENWDMEVVEIDKVPMKFNLIKRNYSFFKHPDQNYYYGASVKLANPFDKYWRSRFLVQ